MRLVTVMLLVLCFAATDALARRDPPPPVGTAAARAKLLVEAIRKNDPTIAEPFFFQREPFRKVKGIKDPDKYFDYLIKVYHKDVRTLREQLQHPDTLEFVRFELGRRKRWVEKRKEANRLPYYANYGGLLVVKDGGREVLLRVRVLITWEGQWYVTHLLRKKLNEKL